MKEGKIVSWNKKVGDKVSSGDVLLVVESDKADMDVESFEEGFLAYIAVKDGEVAEVGAPLGYLAASAAEVGAVQAWVAGASGSPAAPASAPAAPAAPAPVAAPAPAGPVAAAISAVSRVVNSGRVAASGYAKAMAREQGIDLSTVSPSRADGYILSKDLSTATATPTATAPATPSTYTPAPGTINASPMARKLASENNLDISAITGTGNFGRVMPDDVLRAAGRFVEPVKATPTAPTAPAPAAAAAVLDGVVPMDGMQKAVAKNMERTLGVPVFRVSREIFTDDFDALYALLKPKGVTVSAMLAKAAAMVLVKHPVVNAAYDVGGGVRYSKDVNIAMAVAIEGGLMTPTIVGADQMDLFQVGRRWKELLGKAKEKKLTPAEYSTGTFTISNLGMFGVAQFDAILPPGTGSILAVAASTPKVVQMKNGYFGVRKSMTVTITCDHRHIYGADAAEFLKDLADLIENHPNTLTMG
ncbi:2-oxoacid dehydrogenases acyltransferase-domain-containing protein [Ochromonadaceae sp. CCMP2298]|nr:2-oxoacid dehydrogenases acyltransferase-domain-containing protein [Ochromonadaceae sp. CCMP2298]